MPLAGPPHWPGTPWRALRLSTAIAAAALLVAGCASAPSASSVAAPPQAGQASRSAVPSALPTPGPWKVVALGDSVTSGGPCGCTPFPQQYAADIAKVRGVPTTADNLGVGGLDSSVLLADLRDPTSVDSAAVKSADIDLVTIGANDFADHHLDVTQGQCRQGGNNDCVQDELARMRSNVSAILNRIHHLRRHLRTALLVTGYWNVFEDGDVARSSFPDIGVKATQELTRRVNDAIRRAALAGGATFVDLYAPFNGPEARGDVTHLLGSDGDHPNQGGQALIARRLVAAGLPGLVQG